MEGDNTQQVVQTGAVPMGTTSNEAPQPQEPLPEQKMEAMIQQKVADEIKKATEVARREIQSIKDKSKAEVESAVRRARLAENTLTATRAHLQTIDPEQAKEVELAELRAKEHGRQTMEQEEAMAREQMEFHQKFQSTLAQFITYLGVDPSDKRIDWADDAQYNYLERQRRVLDSVAKIQKENVQTTQSSWEKRLKALEAKEGQANIEANSVNTAVSQGAATGPDAEFLKKFGAGELPTSRANVDRYNKIAQQYR